MVYSHVLFCTGALIIPTPLYSLLPSAPVGACASPQMYFRLSDPFNERWQAEWILSCFWHVLTFVMLLLICVLWSPSQNANRWEEGSARGRC